MDAASRLNAARTACCETRRPVATRRPRLAAGLASPHPLDLPSHAKCRSLRQPNMSSTSIETALDVHTATLADTSTAWDARAAALRAIATFADDVEGSPSAAAALSAALPALAPQLAAAVSELRSAVVRDACAAVAALSHALGPVFAAAAAEQLTPALLRASRVTIAVVAASAARAATAMFTYCAAGVPPRVTGLLARAVVSRGEKSHPAVRAAAAEYLGLLLQGDVMEMLPERVADEIQAAVAEGCADSAKHVRDISRRNWRLLRRADSRRAAEVFAKMPANVQTLLNGNEPRSCVKVGGSAMMPTPVSRVGPSRSRGGGPRRALYRPLVRAESDTSTSPPLAARPPKSQLRRPPVAPKRTESAVRREPPTKSKPANPFAKRPARRSMAIGMSGPLLRPEHVHSLTESSQHAKNVGVVASGRPSGVAASAPSLNLPNPSTEDVVKALEAPMSVQIASSRSSTEVSQPEISDLSEVPVDDDRVVATHPDVTNSEDVQTPSSEVRRGSSLACSETEDSDFSSAKGSPTPLASSRRTPSPTRSGLGGLLDEPVQEFSPGSPLFPPTPEAVRQAARKARISFMCGPNVSPGPFDTATLGMRNAPPVALMLPLREHQRMSSSSHSSRSASASPSPSRARATGLHESPLEDLFGKSNGSNTRDMSFVNAAVASISFDDEVPSNDQVAASALLDMNRGDDCAQFASPGLCDSEAVQYHQTPLPSVSEMFGACVKEAAASPSDPSPGSASRAKLLVDSSCAMGTVQSDGVALTETFSRASSHEDRTPAPPVLSQLAMNIPHVLKSVSNEISKKVDSKPSVQPAFEAAILSNSTGSASKSSRRASTSILAGVREHESTPSRNGNRSIPDISRRVSLSTPSPAQHRNRTPSKADSLSDRSSSSLAHRRAASGCGRHALRISFVPPSGSSDCSATQRLRKHTSTIHTDGPRASASLASPLSPQHLSMRGSPAERSSREPSPTTERTGHSAKAFSEALKRIELSRSSGWEVRVEALGRLQASCGRLGPETLDVRLALRAFSVLSEMTSDGHIKVVPSALDALFSVFLGVENSMSSDSFNPLQIALERRPDVVQRVLVCLVDSRATTRLAAERVMHSLVAQFRPEVRAMQIVRAMSYMFSSDKSRKGPTNIGSPKVMVVGCTHLLAAFRSAEASGEGFVWQPVSLLASLLETMAVLLRDRRAEVRSAAGPVVLAAHSSLPAGAMSLALDALPLAQHDKMALQSALSTLNEDAAAEDMQSCITSTSAAGGC